MKGPSIPFALLWLVGLLHYKFSLFCQMHFLSRIAQYLKLYKQGFSKDIGFNVALGPNHLGTIH